MQDLLTFLITEITGTDDFKIEENEEEGRVNFTVQVDSENIGLIIGKNGKTIKAIQGLMRIRGKLEKKSVFVNVGEIAE